MLMQITLQTIIHQPSVFGFRQADVPAREAAQVFNRLDSERSGSALALSLAAVILISCLYI